MRKQCVLGTFSSPSKGLGKRLGTRAVWFWILKHLMNFIWGQTEPLLWGGGGLLSMPWTWVKRDSESSIKSTWALTTYISSSLTNTLLHMLRNSRTFALDVWPLITRTHVSPKCMCALVNMCMCMCSVVVTLFRQLTHVSLALVWKVPVSGTVHVLFRKYLWCGNAHK